MTQRTDIYTSPLVERNASKEMAELFGADKKFTTWRKLWLELARAEKKLGLKITDVQLKEMEKHLDGHRLRQSGGIRKEIPSRCDGACAYVRRCGSEGGCDYSLGGNELLCGR